MKFFPFYESANVESSLTNDANKSSLVQPRASIKPPQFLLFFFCFFSSIPAGSSGHAAALSSPWTPSGADQGGACGAGRIAAGSHAAGVNHMNVPPEQIGSGEAGRPGRPRRSAQHRVLTSKAVRRWGWRGGRREEESERGPGQTLQRPLWLMPGLICVATKPSDDAIAGPRAKSAPIQIKMEVFPCTSTVRKILWVFDWSLSTLQVKVLGHPLTLLLDESQWGGKRNRKWI